MLDISNLRRPYAQVYADSPQAPVENQRDGIPVDNLEFSTFSTVFSTGVIHRACGLWIFIFCCRHVWRRWSEKSYFLTRGGILPRGDPCVKNRVLTAPKPVDTARRKGRREKNSKRGLILSCGDAIMCVCMES